MKFMQEKEMLESTVDRKGSIYIYGEPGKPDLHDGQGSRKGHQAAHR